jgi:hypothetical protein
MNVPWRAMLVSAPILLNSGTALAGEWDFTGTVTLELRTFPQGLAFPEQEDAAFSPSLAVEPEFVYDWNDGDDRLTFTPFVRWDADDDNRTHADIREASWLHLGSDWDLVVGIDKVFWGVTESRHLVDIINQTDGVENIDNEDKLGQPMVNLNLHRDWGTLSFFVLPGFRGRTFPDSGARLSGPIQIDGDNPTFDSSAKRRHVDFALRWQQTIGNWDIGLGHFHGTSREPRFLLATRNEQTVLTPHYDQIDQTSLDLQFTSGATLWKLEAITRSGQGDRFFAGVGGLEHTFFGVFGTRADIGVLAEYQYDGRDKSDAPLTSADDDFFVGARLTLNDERDTALLMGAVIDRTTQASLLFVEAERRLNDTLKLMLEGRFFVNVPDNDPAAGLRDDSFMTLRLSKFF